MTIKMKKFSAVVNEVTTSDEKNHSWNIEVNARSYAHAMEETLNEWNIMYGTLDSEIKNISINLKK